MTLTELKKMNKAQLQEACASFEIVFEDSAKKDELIDLLVKSGHVEDEGELSEEEKLSIELQGECVKREIDLNGTESVEELKELIANHDASNAPKSSDAPKVEEEVEFCPFEDLQKDGFVLIGKIKALATERRKQNKPTARLDAAVSQIERLIKNNFIK